MCCLLSEFEKAQKHMEKIIFSLPAHITSMSFSTYNLIQLVAINLFAMHHCKRKLHVEENGTLMDEMLGKEEQMGYNIVLRFTGSDTLMYIYVRSIWKALETYFELNSPSFTVQLLDSFLASTPKQEKAKEYYTLPAIKVLLDWMCADKQIFADPILNVPT